MGMLSWEGTTVSSFCESTLAVTVHIGSFLTKVVGFLHFCFAKIHSEAFNFTKKRFHWRCFHVSFTKHWFRCTRIKTERAVQSYCVIVIRYSFGKFYCLKYVREDTAYLLKLNSTFLVIIRVKWKGTTSLSGVSEFETVFYNKEKNWKS